MTSPTTIHRPDLQPLASNPTSTMALVAIFALTAIALLIVGGDPSLRILGLALLTALTVAALFTPDRLLADAAAAAGTLVYAIIAFVWGATGDRAFVEDGFLPALVIALALGAVWAIVVRRVALPLPSLPSRPESRPASQPGDLLEEMLSTRIAHDSPFAVALAAIDEHDSQPAAGQGDSIIATVRDLLPAAALAAHTDVAFALVLPVALEEAVLALQQLSETVAREHSVQLRFGVAAFPDDGRTAERLIAESGEALDLARLWGLAAASRLVLGRTASQGQSRPRKD